MGNEKDMTKLYDYVLGFCPEKGRGNAILSVEGELTLLGKRLVEGLTNLLATARAEEREAAFKDAVSVVTAKADELRQTESFGTGVISASVQILEALERAAVATENRKGEG